MKQGASFDLDFHTIPFHGDDALVQKHDVSKRSRRHKGILALLAHDADTRVFCYANGQLRKEEQHNEMLQFVDYWQQRTGQMPQELLFDSKLTTSANLNRLHQRSMQCITIRRRSHKMLADMHHMPASA